MPEQRQLRFEDWSQVNAELDRLLLGYQPLGDWNLEQAARHLNAWLSFPMDGFPKPAWPIRTMLSLMRILAGKKMLQKMLAEGTMKPGNPSLPETVYEASDSPNEQAAIDELKSTISRFDSYSGPIHASPLYGEMDKDTAQQLQFVHFAHHLGFLAPKSA